MNSSDLKKRTKVFALEIIKLVNLLPQSNISQIISKQILRSATSVGANYRVVSRAKSNKDFINKLKICEEESDETIYWLELIEESGLLKNELTEKLIKEANELTSIFVASINTTKKKLNQKSNI
ncbi:MAG: four helix bundle protein [Bacteroidetes bacterium GWA2_31_9b]|nr:MAG: four helix bundle protein [Bacteroidetes bacterium GWA2_31_9b]